MNKIDMLLSGKYLDKRDLVLNLNNINIDEYPNEDRIDYLKSLIANKFNKNINNIVLGAASNGIIQNLVKLLFINGGTLLTSDYSFVQPEIAVLRIGGNVKRVKTIDNFMIDFDSFKSNIDSNTKAIFLCNPNNPTGYYYEPSKIIELAKSINIPIIVSEAAIEFTKKESLLDYEFPENIIVTRTFSKAYGLAGLRIGYAYLSGKYLELYNKKITRFEVSILSIETAILMLENNSIENNIELVIKERDYLKEELNKLGISTLKSYSNAIMTSNKYNIKLFNLLEKNNVFVSKIDSDIKDYYYIRIAIQDHEINKMFIDILRTIDINKYRGIYEKERNKESI